MDDSILSLSERGQLTIPKSLREKISVKRFIAHFEDGKIILEPLQTREEFFEELEKAEEDWEKNGGLTLDKMKKKYNH